jgi:ABC-type Fe3+/spermidine/putrescine transport system ATPase subunit
MVFQRYANRPDLSVFDNVAFPFRLKLWKSRVPEAEWRQRVADMLKAVGLADKPACVRRSSPAARTSAWHWRAHWSCGRAYC